MFFTNSITKMVAEEMQPIITSLVKALDEKGMKLRFDKIDASLEEQSCGFGKDFEDIEGAIVSIKAHFGIIKAEYDENIKQVLEEMRVQQEPQEPKKHPAKKKSQKKGKKNKGGK